jgi:hypothetical protein
VTDRSDPNKLVEVSASGLVISVKEIEAVFEDNGMVALRASILDPDDLQPSGKTLIVQMLPVDAYAFAIKVQQEAKEKAWSFPGDAKFVKWREDRSRES